MNYYQPGDEWTPTYESVNGNKHTGLRRLTLNELEAHLNEALQNKAMLQEEMRLTDEKITSYQSLIAAYVGQPDIRDYTSKPE